VLTGQDAGFIGALCWLSPQRAAQVAGAGGGASAAAMAAGAAPAALPAGPAAMPAGPAALAAGPAALVADLAVRAEAARALDRYNAGHAATSRQIRRLILLAEPPSLADGEITDKSYLNQRAVLRRRAGLVATLHAAEPPAEVICWPGEPSAE
jgi:hypothetical protein